MQFDRIHMDHQSDIQLFSDFPLNTVNDCMGYFNIHIVRHLCMNGCHSLIWSVIMHDQIMRSDNTIIGFYHL